MDLQLAQIVLTALVGLLLPAIAWIVRVSVGARLDALGEKVAALQASVHRFEVLTAAILDARLVERVTKLEARIAHLEGRVEAS